ncbi:MAG: hypothetical protein K0U68_06810 [Gammaproteobacteria bacterium]|nr:hypothetical protein [Gammaproteobacteria bacterium]
MTEFKGVSFSISSNSQTKPQADYYAFDQCAAFSLPDGMVMLNSYRTGKRILMPADSVGLLSQCTTFKSIDAHIEHLINIEPGVAEHKQQISQIFEDLKHQGMLESAQQLIGRLKLAPEQADHPADFAGVFIRTCDRPEQLSRLMGSFADNQKLYGQAFRFYVVDDSRKPESGQQNQKLCRHYHEELDLDVDYYGEQEQKEFISHLIQHFPAYEQIIQWLLGRAEHFDSSQFSGGRLLNHIILKAAGQRFAIFDDDAVCQPYQSPEADHRWNFNSYPKDTWFYENREQLFNAIKPLEFDPLSSHLEVLGCSVGRVLRELSAVELSLDTLQGVSSEKTRNLSADTRVLITRNGTFGDPGTALMTWMYQQGGKTYQHLIEDEEQYRKYASNRTTWLGSHTFRAVNESALMTTTLTGIDGSQIIPPTGPYFRNEDYLFSRLLKFIHPDSLIFEFPWGLPHLPEPARQWHTAKLDEPKTVGILGFMADLANNVQRLCLAEAPQQRLDYVGETYRTLANASYKDLSQGIEENLLHARVAVINDQQSMLAQQPDSPEFWKKDVLRLIETNKNGIAQVDQRLFPDAGIGESRQQQVDECRKTLGVFGDSLAIWVQLWDYCRKNNTRT